jgi:hypothetical protein
MVLDSDGNGVGEQRLWCVYVYLVGVHVEVLGYTLVLGQESVCKPTTEFLYKKSGVTVVSQWCYSGVTGVLQWCYSGVTVVLQGQKGVCKLTPVLLCKSRGEWDGNDITAV